MAKIKIALSHCGEMCASIIWKISLCGTTPSSPVLVTWRQQGEWKELRIRRQIWVLPLPLTGNDTFSSLGLSFFSHEMGIALPPLLWSGYYTSLHPRTLPVKCCADWWHSHPTSHRTWHIPSGMISPYFLPWAIKLWRHVYVHAHMPINYWGLSSKYGGLLTQKSPRRETISR